MTYLRFRLWLFGQSVCDVIGGPLDAAILRIPFLRDRTGACLLLHGVTFRGDIRDEWWSANWTKPA